MKRSKFKYNKENITSRLFAQNRKRRPSHYDYDDEDDEEEDEEEDHRRGNGGAGAAAMGIGAAGLGLAGQGLSALGTVQGVHEQGKGVKGWFNRNKRRKEDYKKFGGDEKLMERKRDQAYRLSKTAKNSQQEAALKHRESEISDSLEWARKKNKYKADMAKQKSWVGKGTTWAKHNPMKAGLAAAGVAAAAGGAYYMWKKRQEEKKRKQREREAQTRHQSRQFAGALGSSLTKGLNKGFRKFPKINKGLRKFPRANKGLVNSNGRSPWGGIVKKPKQASFVGASKNAKINDIKPAYNYIQGRKSYKDIVTTPKTPSKFGTASKINSTSNTSRNAAMNAQKKVNANHDAFKLHDDRMNARKAKERKAELTNRREAKQNDQARRDLAQKKAHERQIGHKEQKVRDLAKQTENLKTSGSGVFSHEYKQSRNELRNANIDLHNTKYKDNKVGDLVARAGGLKKFDKNGNLRWGKKRLALAGLGAAAAYNMMKDDDDK